jgi:hypothetical protein
MLGRVSRGGAHAWAVVSVLLTYDGIAVTKAHLVAEVVERLDVLLAAAVHGDVLDDEALVAPGAHRFDVKLLIFRGDVEDGRAAAEGQPAVSVGEVLLRHGWALAGRVKVACRVVLGSIVSGSVY